MVQRWALVVGVNNCKEGVEPLKLAEKDAEAMARKLEQMDYHVTVLCGCSSTRLHEAVKEVRKAIEPRDVFVAFFAGHGSEHRGEQYLWTSNTSGDPGSLYHEAMPLFELLHVNAQLSVVFLDCCRFVKSTGRFEGAFSPGLQPPRNVFIAYACAPRKAACEFPDATNGCFTEQLLQHLDAAQSLHHMMQLVTEGVTRRTRGLQVPWVSYSNVPADSALKEASSSTTSTPSAGLILRPAQAFGIDGRGRSLAPQAARSSNQPHRKQPGPPIASCLLCLSKDESEEEATDHPPPPLGATGEAIALGPPAVAFQCVRPGCRRPPWNGLGGECCSPACRDALARARAAPPPRPTPAYVFPDPRGGGGQVGVVAFFYPDREESWDRACGASFLSNFYPLEVELQLQVFGTWHSFQNTEAAFQALKFWSQALLFEQATGGQAWRLKKQLKGQEDWTYSGRGSNWVAMWDVLEAKFRGPAMRAALVATGDAFLLHHESRIGREKVWSDNLDGTGSNWLGLQLMLLRERLQPGCSNWAQWLQERVDLKSGMALKTEWQETVLAAAYSVQRRRL